MSKELIDDFPLYGNFKNYYTFNPVESRMNIIRSSRLLTDELRTSSNDFRTLIHYDIGSNIGDLSKALNTHLRNITSRPVQTIAIDMDEDLVSIATQKHSLDSSSINFKCIDVMNISELNTSPQQFTIVTCFSITMWIHIHHGDDGLLKFLDIVSKNVNVLIIEPQEWRSYLSAMRRRRRSGLGNAESFTQIRIRGENVTKKIAEYVQSDCKMNVLDKSFNCTQWNRTVLFFKKT
ncbi:hypothetical protein ACOME3_006306 [Neoechinorhynchus agilis]